MVGEGNPPICIARERRKVPYKEISLLLLPIPTLPGENISIDVSSPF
jgi:hypothetical protein